MSRTKLRSKAKELISYSRFGLFIIAFVIALRLSGLLQLSELLALDKFQQVKIGESPDDRITLISIDEDYLSNKGDISLEYLDLAKLLKRILSYQPAIIGVDIVKNDMSGVGKQQLADLFNSNEQLFTIETVRPPVVLPLEGLSQSVIDERVGFNDFSLDADGRVRRMFLGWKPPDKDKFQKSFALMLAEHYLQNKNGIEIENGKRDRYAMKFGNVEIPRLNISSGGYRSERSIYGIQTLLNFRGNFLSSEKKNNPFKTLLASDLEKGNVTSSDISDKIILLGLADPRKAIVFTSGISNELTGLELQAHATSQVISAVIDERSLIYPLHLSWEHILVFVFGLVGISFKEIHKTTLTSFFLLCAINFLVIFISYLYFSQQGLWLPIVPIILTLTINGFIYTAIAQSIEISQSNNRWKALIEERDRALAAVKIERQRAIEQAFDTIHNGPLQTLANLLRLIKDSQIDRHDIGLELQKLNQEIREIGESLRQEAIGDKQLYVQVGKSKLDLNLPMHELFYAIYRETMQRPFPGFKILKAQVRSFKPVEPENMPIECKRKLCRFFEEALCNVGRHATGATKLTVTGETKGHIYYLKITDNGIGTRIYNLPGSGQGRGTKIGYELEYSLQGRFTRKNIYPNGFLCEFKWPLSRNIQEARIKTL